MKLTWSVENERRIENGCDRGILFIPTNGAYNTGVVWNGLVNVNEQPSGAEATKHYADNIPYITLVSAEEFGATLEVFMTPKEFDQFDGVETSDTGVAYGQQDRGVFGLYYRTNVATAANPQAGHKHHLVYGATAAPSERSYATVGESPEPATFSYTLTTQPVAVADRKPTATITIDSTDSRVSPTNLQALLDILYGTVGSDPRMPLPDEVEAILGIGIQHVTPQPPAYDGLGEITFPVTTGVEYFNGETQVTGSIDIVSDTIITARPASGYVFQGVYVDRWLFEAP